MISDELLRRVEQARLSGKSIGLVQGSWDLFHLGHLRYLREAAKLCDFLVIGMDSDEKIRKRKGPSRPIIPEEERNEFLELLYIADEVVVKDLNEQKWGLINAIKPDVLIAIKDNYSDEEILKLEEICGSVKILPRQAEGSTSDIIRKITIASRLEKTRKANDKVLETIEKMKSRIGYNEKMPEPIQQLFEHIKESTDYVCPVCTVCFFDGNWYYGTNQVDFSLPDYDIENRTELYYSTVEHAEINLLKKLTGSNELNIPIWTTLFPCDKCMKVLINKGVKEIYYLEDHPDKNWSKRSHELAQKNNIKTVKLIDNENVIAENNTPDIDMNSFKYIYPPNARKQEQLNIMMNKEMNNIDPLDPNFIDQEILYKTDYWYISLNKFPYEGVEKQFLIVSRYPVYNKEDISKEMWTDLNEILQDLTKKYEISGGALCFRFGDPSRSGASLKRLHCHIIMPKENEKTKFNIGGYKALKKELKLNNGNK